MFRLEHYDDMFQPEHYDTMFQSEHCEGSSKTMNHNVPTGTFMRTRFTFSQAAPMFQSEHWRIPAR